MQWSFSDLKEFRKCPRKWYFSRKVAHHSALDPLRKEAYRLKKNPSTVAWRGTLVDESISTYYIGALLQKRPAPSRQDLLEHARQRFEKEKDHIRQCNLQRPSEEGRTIDEDLRVAWEEIEEALVCFDYFQKELGIFSQVKIYEQKSFTFTQDTPFGSPIKVKGTPDLVTVRFTGGNIFVYDWKVHRNSPVNFRQQLVVYTLCILNDQSVLKLPSVKLGDIVQYEVQLLDESAKRYHITERDIDDMRDLIVESSWQMEQATQDTESVFDLEPARDEHQCKFCAYQTLCQEERKWSKPPPMSSLF